MLSEATSTARSALPARAAIALLTLQLRAALETAAAAETDAVSTDHSAAREQLRARLEPLMEERRGVLDAALAQTWADAAAEVAAAERAAAVMVAQATARISEVAPPVEKVLAPVVGVDLPPVLVTESLPEPFVEPVVEPTVEPTVELVARPEAVALPVAAEPGQYGHAPLPTTVVIDAEGFATVFATVIASLLDERMLAWGSAMPTAYITPTPALLPVPVPVPVKQSFWTHARHPDVILMGLTMVIVLVVLAAWLA